MEELDVKQIVKYVYQRKNILIYILLTAILIGTLYAFIIKRPQYEVTSKILIDKVDASISDFVTSKDIISDNENIKVKFDKTSKLISITTTMKNPQEALDATNKYIEVLEEKLEEVYDTKTFKVISAPKLPQKASNINYIKDIAIFLVVGVIVYFVYIFLVLSFSGVTNCIQIENMTGINVLGQVHTEIKKGKIIKKDIKEDVDYDTKDNVIIDNLKRIEASIEFDKDNEKPKMILFTGTDKNVGNSYIVNNLASQYAKIYNKVLILDTDIVSKSLTNYYGQNKGLTDIIENSEIEDIEKLVQQTNKDNVFFLPVGNKEVQEDIFLKDNIDKILIELKQKYDVILIDSTSINENIIPIHLANIADSSIITIEYGKTKIETIQKAKSTIEKVGGKVIGIIMNKSL